MSHAVMFAFSEGRASSAGSGYPRCQVLWWRSSRCLVTRLNRSRAEGEQRCASSPSGAARGSGIGPSQEVSDLDFAEQLAVQEADLESLWERSDLALREAVLCKLILRSESKDGAGPGRAGQGESGARAGQGARAGSLGAPGAETPRPGPQGRRAVPIGPTDPFVSFFTSRCCWWRSRSPSPHLLGHF